MTEPVDDQAESPVPPEVVRISFRKWAWTPLYAKVWWSLAAIYWMMFFLCSYLKALNWLHEFLYLSFLSIVFHPFMMLPMMGFGTFERWWHAHQQRGWQSSESDHRRRQDLGPSGLHWDIDPLDPRSAAYWSRRNKLH